MSIEDAGLALLYHDVVVLQTLVCGVRHNRAGQRHQNAIPCR